MLPTHAQLNFVWAMGYNVLMIPFAAGIFFPLLHVAVPPWMAGGAMAMSSVCVVTSSLFLKRYTPPDAEKLAAKGRRAKCDGAGVTPIADSYPLLGGRSGSGSAHSMQRDPDYSSLQHATNGIN